MRQTLVDFGSWDKAWAGTRKTTSLNPEKEWQKVENSGVRLIMADDVGFPKILKETSHSPFGLYIQGANFDDRPRVAIVGTRRATTAGKTVAYEMARGLATAGVTVVSGLAAGIDAAAHQGALDAGGKTIAVLAHGLDQIYPSQNTGLAKRILKEGGTLVSEYPPGPVAYAARFLERNRIVSGLCSGVVIIEAPQKSGALATAKFAIDQNRELFIVPGSLNHPHYVGSHRLLREGARFVTSAADILEDLQLPSTGVDSSSLKLDFLSEPQQKLVRVLREAGKPVSIDELSDISKMEISELNQSLTLLLIQGVIKEERGYYS